MKSFKQRMFKVGYGSNLWGIIKERKPPRNDVKLWKENTKRKKTDRTEMICLSFLKLFGILSYKIYIKYFIGC